MGACNSTKSGNLLLNRQLLSGSFEERKEEWRHHRGRPSGPQKSSTLILEKKGKVVPFLFLFHNSINFRPEGGHETEFISRYDDFLYNGYGVVLILETRAHAEAGDAEDVKG